jgi:hypothetical protein
LNKSWWNRKRRKKTAENTDPHVCTRTVRPLEVSILSGARKGEDGLAGVNIEVGHSCNPADPDRPDEKDRPRGIGAARSNFRDAGRATGRRRTRRARSIARKWLFWDFSRSASFVGNCSGIRHRGSCHNRWVQIGNALYQVFTDVRKEKPPIAPVLRNFSKTAFPSLFGQSFLSLLHNKALLLRILRPIATGD